MKTMIRAAEEEDAKDLALLAAKFFGQEQLEGTGLKIEKECQKILERVLKEREGKYNNFFSILFAE